MRCRACGGDGLVEMGAYRGDEHSALRPCQLCGGIPDTDLEWLKESQLRWEATRAASPSASVLPPYTETSSDNSIWYIKEKLR